ncbi:MAG: hypothetical protein WCQ47_03985 [bacterium]
MTKKFFPVLIILLVSCCSTTPPEFSRTVNFVPSARTRVYQANYDYTWKVAMEEMQRYPLVVANKDAGTITTQQIISISDRYETPDVVNNQDPRGETKYYIDIKITELAPVNNVPQTEVSVVKYLSKLSQLGTSKPLESDYLDEAVILHRIKRLLEIERLKLERNRK